VIGKVVPIDNQQLAFTLGGPIRKDRLHFFTHFEYEREPKTSVWNTPYPAFNVELHGPETVKMGGGRFDYQLSSNMRVMGKVTDAEHWQPFTPGNNSHPAATGSTLETNREYSAQFTQVLSNRAVNEINGGKDPLDFRERQPYDLVASLAGTQRRDHRVAAHHVRQLRHRRQRVLSAVRRSGQLEPARQFHLLIRRARPARRESRR
jgi:hypothetical protein